MAKGGADAVQVILTVLAYIFQVTCTCAAAVVIWFVIIGMLKLLKVKTNKRARIICLVLVLVILCVVLAYICKNPIVICPDEYNDIVTNEQIQNIQSVASGLYSKNLPLIPARVKIENVQWAEMLNEYEMKFRIDYLFFGNIKMVVGGDGIDIVKPLSGL